MPGPAITLDTREADDLVRLIDDDPSLTGLDLYYELERRTPLRELHTMLRQGPKNRSESGLQQSYGDHNRLLLLGIDRMLEGDLDWYRRRLESPDVVDDARLRSCFAHVAALGLDRTALVALWLGCGLHDCGMLAGNHGSFDVEDGVAVAAPVFDALCPPAVRPLADFAVRNHDYIKDVFLGEIPPGFIAAQIDELPASLRPAALTVLGMIQVAGSASLGEGRLSSFRMEIFERCSAGTALDDRSTATRLRRLLADGHETMDAPEPEPGVASSALAGPLATVPIHGWHRAWSTMSGDRVRAKLAALDAMARALADASDAGHVAIAPGADLGHWQPTGERIALANGSVVLLLR
jgi:hypothetical protein